MPAAAISSMDRASCRISAPLRERSTKDRLNTMLVNEASTAPTPAVPGGMPPCAASDAAAATELALDSRPPTMLTK